MPQVQHADQQGDGKTAAISKHAANLINFYHFPHLSDHKSLTKRRIGHHATSADPSPHQRVSLLNSSVCTTPLITRHIIKASQRA